MKVLELEHYLEHNYKDLFNFAFSLLPDDLQAQQLVLDSVQVLLLDDNELIRACIEKDDFSSSNPLLKQVKNFLLKSIYNIASKRFSQIRSSIIVEGEHAPFYALPFEEKAILFLKHKLNLNFSEIEEVTGLARVSVIEKLNSARSDLATNLGITFSLGSISSGETVRS
ncbi:MAG: hypothetical protein A2504_17155 [Bdellovibrionales bacterium RIFOXYD12_FULL_39_22]|nr:MAG: hypothetical protein A2385_10805 [Bdellovibrionales bacterium RIFOXYB1_FULL_39_21]OFZ40735.1 MAG: hypothetical protein A2485_16925 [Bdellovibrionales bacterium RIFOXYC12_FULL_39_17]OFZ48157.1 MAG: hypothetical protein A2404_17085 [Bdellovibrionales bacterium RIFOXYC1_FULL_39_130]OFZ71416.1 MAG: hypothetical protein A2451_10680 [Bdellovibrionales bacterium RIFOXYC2_FULL_39_8]OFZ75807.1 MAG: hypothetical protein A2560_13585 [Bdellovibrionales bacterium RIFOXYD1_FULL_39_84]OFZ91868.1 MAG: